VAYLPKSIEMALIKSLRNHTPEIGKDCFLAENCTIIGDVVLGDECTIWYQAVIRGDVNSIRIGHRVNIQDLAMIHCTYKTAPTRIGNDVSIGHGAIVHGCTIEDEVLVGMGSIIMDGCIIGRHSIIAAGAVVVPGTIIPEGTVYAGTPAKQMKNVTLEQKEHLIKGTAQRYVKYASWYKD
jgi:carbonic anhydrase/acetyltransferase-like protein (isoleucine patch superfamily)